MGLGEGPAGSGPRDRHLGLFLRQTAGAAWSTDGDLRVVDAQGGALASIGLDPAAVIGRTLAELTERPPDEDVLVVRHRAALATGEPQRFAHECRGRSFDVLVEPLRDREGVRGC